MKTLTNKAFFLFLLFFLGFNSISFGVTRYWVSAIAGNFNTAGNWSTTSGGAPVGGAPAVGDITVFDGGGLGNCTFTANYLQTTGGIQITSAYTGIISTSTFNVTFGSAHFSQAGGTFTCGSGTISMTAASTFTLSGGTFTRTNGTFTNLGGVFNISGGIFNGGTGNITIAGATTLSGGTLNSTTGIFTINNSFTKTGGTFNNNSGTFAFGGNATYQINTNLKLVFNNLTFNGAGISCIRNINSDTLDVNGTLTFAGASRFAVQNSIIRAFGNITATNTYVGQNTHTGCLILICGTGNQTLTGSDVSLIRAYLPTIQINKPSGTLIFINKICVEGNWRYEAGTLDYTTNTNTICFIFGKNFTGLSHNLGNVEFTTTTVASAFNLGSIILTVNGTLKLSGGTGQLQLQNSTIQAKGNIDITHIRTTTNSSSTIILINGAGNQTINGTVSTYQGRLPAVTINKTTGTLFLINNVTIEGNYIYTTGTIDFTTNANTVCFYGVGSTQTLTGSHTLGNVEFYGSAGNIYSLSGVGMNLTINETLTFSGASQFRITGGTINVRGDIAITNSYNANNSHTTSIIINGTADQAINSSGSAGLGRLPNVTVNKVSGNLFLSGTISTEGNWTFTAGNVDPQTSTMVFFNTGKTIDGEGTSVTMEFYNAILGDASTRTLLGDFTIQNVIDLQTGRILLNSNSLTLENGTTAALDYTSGAIISENTANLSKVIWMIGTNTGAHVFPFENLTTFDIPFTFNLTSGDAGTVTLSTYPTAANNTPYPVTPQTVTNVNSAGMDNSANTVNRFWQIDKTGANPVADLTFTYADNDWDISEPANYQAQRYEVSLNMWQPALGAQTSNSAQNQVIVPGVTTFSPWTLATASSPLAIEMLSYDVRTLDKSVLISWAVFTETDVIEYEIQKTNNLNDELTIGFISGGNLQYEFTDNNPLEGISYYRVVAKLINGEEEFFDWKKAEFNSNNVESFLIYPNPIENGDILTIQPSNLDIQSVQLFDLSGKIIFEKEIQNNGNIIQVILPENISQGCYILSLGDKKSRLIVK